MLRSLKNKLITKPIVPSSSLKPAAAVTSPAPSSKATAKTVMSKPTSSSTAGTPGPSVMSKQRKAALSCVDATADDLLANIPSLDDAPPAQRHALFVRKLRLCQVIFDFADQSDHAILGREAKRVQLMQLIDHVGRLKGTFTEEILNECTKVISINVIRPLPPESPETELADPATGEEMEVEVEPMWPHLRLVYELFQRLLTSGDVDKKLLKKWIDGKFVARLISLFNSQSLKERDYLKTITHRVYAKCIHLRSFIRAEVNRTLLSTIETGEHHRGLAEILEIMGSIINGFAIPLKAEHKRFLIQVLGPLHKAKNLETFHAQLSYCVTQFADKEAELSVNVVNALLRYWPYGTANKQMLFLNELEEILELVQAEHFQQILTPLCRTLALTISDSHFQVAERALFLWNNPHVAGMLNDLRKQVVPVLYPRLLSNSNSATHHWNESVVTLSLNVLKNIMDSDPSYVEEFGRKHAASADDRKKKLFLRRAAWDAMKPFKP